jgi:thiamine-monophosphate kinase
VRRVAPRLGPGAEFDRIRAIFAGLGPAGRGLGDDAGLVRVGSVTLAASVDLSLEGVHFRTGWLSFRDIGRRAASAALSDLAATGARPLAVLVSVGLPPRPRRVRGDPAAEIMAGVGRAALAVGAHVIGGDVARSRHYLVDVCVLGVARRPVRRRGARRGDGVWVTGSLGGAGRALAALRAGARPRGALWRRFARPEPRVTAGRWLAAHGARAMIDISDGLVADAGHIAAASSVAIELDLGLVPCWPGVPPRVAAASGEEYELLAVMPVRFGVREARAFRRATGLPLTRVGRCRSGSGLRVTDQGEPVSPPRGFDHFAP